MYQFSEELGLCDGISACDKDWEGHKRPWYIWTGLWSYDTPKTWMTALASIASFLKAFYRYCRKLRPVYARGQFDMRLFCSWFYIIKLWYIKFNLINTNLI